MDIPRQTTRTYLAVPPETSPQVDRMLDGFVGWAHGRVHSGWIVYAVPADMVDRVVELGGVPYDMGTEGQ